MMSHILAHLHLALRVCAVTVLFSALLFGVGKVVTPSEKSVPAPEMSSVVTIPGLDFDTGHAYLNSAYFAGFLPASASLYCEELESDVEDPNNMAKREDYTTIDLSRPEEARSVSEDLWNDIYAHIHRVNEISLMISHFANYSNIESEDDERLAELSERVRILDNERQELLRRLLTEVAGFDGYYDFVIGNTILPTWVTFTMNTVGLERAMASRRGDLENSDIPDFSRPEVYAELTSHILYIPGN